MTTKSSAGFRLLTRKDVAGALGVSERTVYRLRPDQLPVIRIGSMPRYHPSDVARLIRRMRGGHADAA